MNDTIQDWLFELQDRHYSTRLAALRRISAHPILRNDVAALIDVLLDQHAGIRDVAAQALGALGPRAQAAVPALSGMLRDPVRFIRHAARQALAQIQPDKSMPVYPSSPQPKRSCV